MKRKKTNLQEKSETHPKTFQMAVDLSSIFSILQMDLDFCSKGIILQIIKGIKPAFIIRGRCNTLFVGENLLQVINNITFVSQTVNGLAE